MKISVNYKIITNSVASLPMNSPFSNYCTSIMDSLPHRYTEIIAEEVIGKNMLRFKKCNEPCLFDLHQVIQLSGESGLDQTNDDNDEGRGDKPSRRIRKVLAVSHVSGKVGRYFSVGSQSDLSLPDSKFLFEIRGESVVLKSVPRSVKGEERSAPHVATLKKLFGTLLQYVPSCVNNIILSMDQISR